LFSKIQKYLEYKFQKYLEYKFQKYLEYKFQKYFEIPKKGKVKNEKITLV